MNLKNVKYINEFRRLPYPKNQMLIIGSGAMALLGLRRNKDIDVWVTDSVIKKVAQDKNFIAKKSKMDGSTLYETKDGKIEIGSTLGIKGEDIKEHLKRAVLLYGIHFHSPEDVLKWKKAVNRPKDKKDIELLEKYLRDKVVESYLTTLQILK